MYNIKCGEEYNSQLIIPDFSIRYKQVLDSNKKNVIYIKEVFDNSTYRYRGYNVIQSMKNSNKYCVNCFLVKELDKIYSLIDKIDIFILQRAKWSFELDTFIKVIKSKNKRIIYDMDDLIYNTKYVPKYLNSIGDYREMTTDLFFGIAKRYQLMSEIADGYIVTTEALKNNVSKDYKKPTWVLSNFLNLEQEKVSKKVIDLKQKNYNDKKFVIGYFSGSNSHVRDLEILESALIKLFNKYDDIYLKIVGYMDLNNRLEKYKNMGRIILSKFVSYEELQYEIGSVDVNIIPLQKNEFNECKSELKYFEASIVNTLSCATNNSVYSNIIKDGKDGYLCDEVDWYEKLEYIYLNRDNLQEVVDNANKKCHKLYDNENQLDKITKIYDEIIEKVGV